MLKTRIIPTLLVKGSSIVKTVQFGDPRIVGDAVATTKVFSARKADEMVIVDIEATSNQTINWALLEKIALTCHMPLTIGGGIAKLEDADRLFRIGADKIVINSAFYDEPSLISNIARKYGSQALVFALDAKHVNDNNYVAMSHAGANNTGITAIEAATSAIAYGAGEIFLNSIDCDGRMLGYDTSLIKIISDSVEVPVIASGGCGTAQHCLRALESGADAIAAGSIFYWVGESIVSLKKELKELGVEVRLK